jgi:hypothetical protein
MTEARSPEPARPPPPGSQCRPGQRRTLTRRRTRYLMEVVYEVRNGCSSHSTGRGGCVWRGSQPAHESGGVSSANRAVSSLVTPLSVGLSNTVLLMKTPSNGADEPSA